MKPSARGLWMGAAGVVLLVRGAAADDQEATRTEARAHSKSGNFAACATLLDQLAADRANDRARSDHYNAGCCHAQGGDSEAAFRSLTRTVTAGYREVEHMERDPDLASLRADPKWKRLVAGARAQQEKFLAQNNRELYEMYVQDQADRRAGPGGIDWSKVNPRDNQRREAVGKLRAAGKLKTSYDHLHAAMILQHGATAEDARAAHELSVRAVELDGTNRQARWLAAAAKDRELMRLARPQRYGTQFRKGESGTWELYQVDPAVTDEERARWNVPPLAEAHARAAAMNAPPPKPAPLMSMPAKASTAK